MEEKYQKIKDIVEKELSCSAHNMEHVMRVYSMCLHLAEDESDVDLEILKTSALLHDIARAKEDKDDSGNIDHAILGAEMAENILKDFGYSNDKIEAVKHCIVAHRFRSGNEPKTKEAKILFDADKLDVIGSIGIARSFLIAGQYHEKMFSNVPVDEYIKDNLVGGKPNGRIKVIAKHAPNLEFETKFIHVPNRLFTEKAKLIGEQRINFMKQFFDILNKDINSKL
ncbi:MAG: HD domain-containing protein [Nanoarchaeota archaeon]|nr:HD domain-containing protein [Nanoarchaeota archaeon]